MKDISPKGFLILWIVCTNYLTKDDCSISKDMVQIMLNKLTTKLRHEGITNIKLTHSTRFYYILEYEFEGLQIGTQFSKARVDAINIKQALKI